MGGSNTGEAGEAGEAKSNATTGFKPRKRAPKATTVATAATAPAPPSSAPTPTPKPRRRGEIDPANVPALLPAVDGQILEAPSAALEALERGEPLSADDWANVQSWLRWRSDEARSRHRERILCDDGVMRTPFEVAVLESDEDRRIRLELAEMEAEIERIRAETMRIRDKTFKERQSAEMIAALQASAKAGECPEVDVFCDYVPHAKQICVHLSFARWLAIVAGRRGGKTYVGAREFIRRIFIDLAKANAAGRYWQHPEGQEIRTETPPLLLYWCVAPIHALTVLAKREIAGIIGKHPILVLKWTETGGLWLEGGVLIEFKTAESDKMLVGSGLSGVWIDEAARVKANAWRDSIRPSLSEHQGWAIFTTTPLGRNWIYIDIWTKGARGEVGYSNHTWNTVDNTAFPALVGEVEEARNTLPPAIFKRNYEANWDAFEGQVFEAFDHSVHVVDQSSIPPWSQAEEIIAGQDWGFSAPGCLLVLARFGLQWIVVAELYEERLHVSPPQHGMRSWVSEAKKVREEWRFSPAYCDTESSENVSHYQMAGIPAQGAVKHVSDGLETTAAYLQIDPRTKRPRLVISSKCVNLIRELPGYRYKYRQDKPTEKPEDGQSDHAVDALRYAIHSHEVMHGGHVALSRLRKYS